MREILEKELKEWARGYKPYAIVSFYLLLLIGLVNLGWRENINRGKTVFEMVAMVLTATVVFVAPALSSSAIAIEKEKKTLDLMLVTLLRPHDIVLGKILSVVIFLMLIIITSVPVLSLGFISGGVSPSEILRLCLILICIGFGITSFGFFVSLVTKKLYPAYGISYGFVILLTVGSIIVDATFEPDFRRGFSMVVSRHINPFFAIMDFRQDIGYFWLFGTPGCINPAILYTLLGLVCIGFSIVFFDRLVKREVI